MYTVIWRYSVAAPHRLGFIAAYGPAGHWARLFAAAAGYVGTELIACDDGTFVTIDRWRGRSAFEAFMSEH